MIYSVIVITLAVLLLVGAWVYPYVTAIMMKARMLKSLRVTARGAGFRYRRSYKNIFFVRNLSRKYDMIIYNEEKLYAVKLWTSYFSYNTLVVTKEGKIREQRRTRPVFQMNGSNTVYTKGFLRRVPRTGLHKKYKKGREVEQILLIYPSYESIRAESGRGYIKLKTGDELFGKIIYSPSAFMTRLREEGTDYTDKREK